MAKIDLSKMSERQVLDLMDACADEIYRRDMVAFEKRDKRKDPMPESYLRELKIAASTVKTYPRWMRDIKEKHK